MALVLALTSVTIAGCASSPDRWQPIENAPSRNDAAMQQALRAYYRQWRGVPYRYGGRDKNGIDCSSFARQALAAAESLRLPRSTDAQTEHGYRVDRADLSAGDLVFFKTSLWDRHVGVYVGDGRFMHASTREGVTMSRLNSRYWRRHYWQSRRVRAVAN